ncbi:MAG: hypothetical protein ACYTGQ_07975 [Planctomycetota bacterium]|jgi:hypothetical protein
MPKARSKLKNPTPPTASPNAKPAPQGLLYAGALFAFALLVVSQGRAPEPLRIVLMLTVLGKAAGVVAAFWLAALGYGWIIRRALQPNGILIQAASGAGILALLFWIAGHLGLIHAGLALATPGWAILLWRGAATGAFKADRQMQLPTWPTLAALLGLPVGLLVACCAIPPGILWASEFAGYDTLSYHLGLQRDWIAAGAVTPVAHNAYSYLPNLIESVYFVIERALPSPTPIAIDDTSGYASQLLHASFALLTAALIAQVVTRLTHQRAAALCAAALYLATPWTLVTGSLAYNEQAMMAFAMASLLLVMTPAVTESPGATLRRDALAGFLVGLAALCKLTALGVFALPIGLIVLARSSPAKNRLTSAALFAAFALLSLAPFLVRNFNATGNPLFPLFAETLGHAHWTAEQATRWAVAHRPPHGFVDSLAAFFREGFAHRQFGFIVLPIILLAIPFGAKHPTARRNVGVLAAVLAVQTLVWFLMTHQQGRFLIPLLGPGCVLVGLTFAAGVRTRDAADPALGAIGYGLPALVAVATLVSLGVYLTEAEGTSAVYIDRTYLIQGPIENVDPINLYHAINALPPDARVYAEGFALPYHVNRQLDYHTVWDASPLAARLATGGPAAAHAWLHDQNYTHVVVDRGMIHLWRSPGNYGYDPRLDLQQIDALALTALRPVVQLPNQTLYRVLPTGP